MSQEIARTIIGQLGGMSRLGLMVGAYNFVALENGVTFKLKNPRANFVKIELTSMDLYKVEVGRIRGDKYTVVTKEDGVYVDKLRPVLEKATGLYLSLYKQGGGIDGKKYKDEIGLHLPYEICIYVPSTKDANVPVSKAELSSRVKEVKEFLATLFGGYSSNQIVGGYASTIGELIQEDVVKVTAFSTKKDYVANETKLVKQIAKWSTDWSQEAIGLEVEGDLYYINQDKKFGKGGNMPKGFIYEIGGL